VEFIDTLKPGRNGVNGYPADVRLRAVVPLLVCNANAVDAGDVIVVAVAVPVKVGEAKDTPDTILVDPTDAGLLGIAFNTELT